MQKSECIENTNVSKVKVEERRSKAIFINTERVPYRKIQVDGCLIKDGRRADWVVEKVGVGHIVVELKGKGVEHAIDQVVETAAYFVKNVPECKVIAGLIVARQYPAGSTRLQTAMNRFLKKYKRPCFMQVKEDKEYIFEEMLGVKKK